MQIPLRQETLHSIKTPKQHIEKYHFKCFYVGFTILKEHGKNICENVTFTLQKIINMSTKILIIGACGQIGTELTHSLRKYTELMLSLLIFEN
jgi:hypothetical protein